MDSFKDINSIFLASLKYEIESSARGIKKRLAEIIDVSTGHFSDMLNGRRGTSEEQRRKIISFLGHNNLSYELFLKRGSDILEGKKPSGFQFISTIGGIPKDDLQLKRLLARVQRDERLKFVGLDDPEVCELNKIIHPEPNLPPEPSEPYGSGDPYESGEPYAASDLEEKEEPLAEYPQGVSTEEIDSAYFKIPFRDDMRLAAGTGSAPEGFYETDESPVAIHKSALRRHNSANLRAFRVGGESMEPAIMRNGIVVADMAQNEWETLKDKGIYIIYFDDETAVKRLRWAKKDETLAILSDNPAFDTVFRDVGQVFLHGRVIWSWREH